MLLTIIKQELRNIVRDPMYIFFTLYPFIMGGIGYLLIDLINNETWSSMVTMLIIVMTSYIYGAVTGFSLLDDKDDKVLISLKVTPLNTKLYVLVKLVIGYLFGVVATLIVVYATGFMSDSSFITIFLISIVSGLQAPFLALVVNSFAQNKVEGFVVMKGTGMVLILPAVAFWLTDWKEFFLAIAPGFWPARMIQIELLPTALSGIEYNFDSIVYFIFGLAYNLLIASLLFKLYTKKSNI